MKEESPFDTGFFFELFNEFIPAVKTKAGGFSVTFHKAIRASGCIKCDVVFHGPHKL